MKKVVSALLIMLMLCNLLPFSAVAAGNGSISMGSASGAQGGSVTLNVNLTNNPGLVTITIKVSYDTSVLQLTKVSDPQLLVGAQLNPRYNSPYTISWVDGTTTVNNTKTGEIAAFTFKILDTAKVGDSTVTLQFVDSYDTNYQENSFSASSGKVSVTCKSHHFGSYTKVNDNQHSRTCSACGHVETVNHSWNGGAVTKQATCKETGTKEYTCTACGAKKTETVAKTNAHTWGDWHITKQPSCTTPGTTTKTCSVCGKTENQTVNATGHSMGGWTQTKAPTCTEKGAEQRSCSKCGHKETRAVNALGHSFSNPTVTKEPTCTEAGVETGKCSRCGLTATNSIKAKGHKFGAWADTKAATCTEGGTQERKCSVCGAAESRTTQALGHDFENPTVVKEATISSTGLKEGKCKRCGEKTSEVIPCTAKDETTGAVFEASEGVFKAGTELTVEEIQQDNPSYASAENVLKDTCTAFKLYNLAAMQNGTAVQPGGELTVTLPIPDGFGSDVALYLLSSDGTAEPIESAVSEDGKTVTAKLTKLGELAVGKLCESAPNGADSDVSADTPTTDEPVAKSNINLYIVIIIVAIVVIGGVSAFVVIKRRRQ